MLKTNPGTESEDLAFFEEQHARSRIRPLQIFELFPGIEKQKVELGAIDPDTLHPNKVDMIYVCAMARQIAAKRIFEFGTYLGRTTYHLAAGDAQPEVFTLDLDPAWARSKELKLGPAVRAVLERGLQGHFYKGSPVAGRVTQLHGDSRVFDFSPYANSMDFIFVDADHSYELIANDTRHAFSMLRKGGVIVWHDYAPKSRGVVSFAQELSQQKPLAWIKDTSLLVYVDGLDPMSLTIDIPPYARASLKPPKTQ